MYLLISVRKLAGVLAILTMFSCLCGFITPLATQKYIKKETLLLLLHNVHERCVKN